MTKDEIIKELKKLRDINNYSENKELNIGYRTGILDAIDLIEKLNK